MRDVAILSRCQAEGIVPDRQGTRSSGRVVVKPGGRLVTGFGEGRGWEFSDFLDMAQKVGYRVDFTFSSWDMKLFSEHSTFLVAVLSRPGSDLLA